MLMVMPPPTATCLTCGSVFSGHRDEDGAPEVPGTFCVAPGCEVWICEGGCLEHHSFHCPMCAGRVCSEHTVARQGWGRMCSVCAERLVTICQECGADPVVHRYADGLGTCESCHRKLARKARRFPSCPDCKHPYWVSDLDERIHVNGKTGFAVVERPGIMYRCDCGLKFTREAAVAAKPPAIEPGTKGELKCNA